MRLWLCFLLLFATDSLSIQAQQSAPASPSLDEEASLHAGVQMDFKEGIFERAQTRAREFLRRFPSSPKRFEVQLVLAKASYFLGNFPEAVAALSNNPASVPEALRSEYVFWLAESLLQAGKAPEAEKKYREVLTLKPPRDREVAAQLGLAWSIYKEGRETEAQQMFAALQASPDSGVAGQKAAIYEARILLGKSQFKEAEQVLQKLLGSKLNPGVFLEANYWLGEIAQADNRLAEAIGKYTVVTSDPRAYPRSLLAQAWFGAGICQQKLQQYDQAMQSLEQAFTIGNDEQLKFASFKLYLQSAQKLNRLQEAEQKLRAFAQQDSASITASAALFAIGSSEADQKQGDQAIATLEAMLTAYPNSIWRAPANYLLGTLYNDKNQPVQALKAFQACLDAGTDEVTQQQVIFQMGAIYFSQGDLTRAAANFQRAASSSGPSAENALFNLLLVQAEREDLDSFLAADAQFEQQFPKSNWMARLTLKKAELLARKGQLDKARQTYQDALARNLDPSQNPLLLLRLADLLYNTGQYAEALKRCEELVTTYPKDAAVPEANYKAIWCSYLLKELTTDQMRTALLEIYHKFPQEPLSARALFNAAEFSYNAHDYVGAQTGFEEVARVFPQSELVDQAQYYAGRSAAERQAYAPALEILDKVKEGSTFKIDARLLQGNIYLQQLRFENAINLFDAVLSTEKTGARFVEATLAKGQCLFALGASDGTRYEQASAAYGDVLTSNQGNAAQRDEAAFYRGRCWELLHRQQDAEALYLEVLNGQTATPDASATSTLPRELPPEIYWRVQAGQRAVELRKKDQDWPGALAIYRKLEQISGPLQAQFHSEISKLRRDHFLYDDET